MTSFKILVHINFRISVHRQFSSKELCRSDYTTKQLTGSRAIIQKKCYFHKSTQHNHSGTCYSSSQSEDNHQTTISTMMYYLNGNHRNIRYFK